MEPINCIWIDLEPCRVIRHQSMNTNAGAAKPVAPNLDSPDQGLGEKEGVREGRAGGGVKSQTDHCLKQEQLNNLSKYQKNII